MGTLRYTGAAQTTAQVNTITTGGVAAAGQVYSVTINAKVVSYTATGPDTNATITAALLALLQASTIGEFAEQTWAAGASSLLITATATTAGQPFTQTSAATGTGTLVTAVTVANSSPSDVGNAANYSTGALPVNGDDLYFDHSSTPLLWNLTALAGVTLNSRNFAATFTGPVGLPEVNTAGATPYVEYRPRYLKAPATTDVVGYGDGPGSGRILLDAGSIQTALTVRQTAAPLDDGLEALQWKGTHAANTVEVTRGSVGIAGYGGDAATVATLRVGFVTSPDGDSYVRCGAGATLTTVNIDGGTVLLNSAATTVTKSAGTLYVYDGAVTTLTDDSGTTFYLSTGTLGTANVGGSATLDFSQDMKAKTVTNCTLAAGATLSDPFDVVTFTNGITPAGRPRLSDVTLDVGFLWKVTQS